MRGLRLFGFLLVGCLLGGGCSLAFASTLIWKNGSSAVVRGPDGVLRVIGLSSPWQAAQGSMGAATARSAFSVGLAGGGTLPVSSARTIPAAALARGALNIAKAFGPYALGLTLAQLIYDEVAKQYMVPPSNVTIGGTPANVCLAVGGENKYYYDSVTDRTYWVPPNDGVGAQNAAGLAFGTFVTNCTQKPPYNHLNAYWPELFVKNEKQLPAGTPATDQQIIDQIIAELQAGEKGGAVAGKLRDLDIPVDADPEVTSGPSSVPGPTSSITSSGPAGTETKTKSTTYDVEYDGPKVSIIGRTTETTTYPDSTTSTTTTVDNPADTGTETGTSNPEQPQQEPPPDFCELHPSSIVCQEMDTPAEDKGTPEQKTFSISPTGGFGGAGSCPADVSVSYLGQPISWSYKPACDFFSGVRPAVVAMAWIAAILIALGGYRKGD